MSEHDPRTGQHDPPTSWSPERKVVGGAAAVVILWLAVALSPLPPPPPGVEGAVAVLVAYLLPN